MAHQTTAMNTSGICLLLREYRLAHQNRDIFPDRDREGTPVEILRLTDCSCDYRRGRSLCR